MDNLISPELRSGMRGRMRRECLSPLQRKSYPGLTFLANRWLCNWLFWLFLMWFPPRFGIKARRALWSPLCFGNVRQIKADVGIFFLLGVCVRVSFSPPLQQKNLCSPRPGITQCPLGDFYFSSTVLQKLVPSLPPEKSLRSVLSFPWKGRERRIIIAEFKRKYSDPAGPVLIFCFV